MTFYEACHITALSLVNSDNERDSVLLNRFNLFIGLKFLLRGTGDY